MTTSSTLKILKEQDGPRHPRATPLPVRAGGLGVRLKTLWRSIWRRRWLSVVTTWIVCAAGWAAITLWPTSFIASAVIYADLAGLTDLAEPKDPQPKEQEAETAPSEHASAPMLKSLLLSEDTLDQLRRRVDLDSEREQRLFDDIVLRSTVPPVFVVAYEHEDPDVAKAVVEAVISSYRTELKDKAAASQDTLKALDGQIEDGQRALQTAEADLVAFKRRNADYLETRGDKVAALELLHEEVDGLKRQVQDATNQRDNIAIRLARVRDPAAEPPRNDEELATERQTLDAELATLRERYADSHPYVVAVFDAIKALDLEVEALQLAAATPADREGLEQRHGELIVEVSTLALRLGEKRQEIEHLEALTRTATSVEAELSELEAEKQELESSLTDLQQRRDKFGDDFGGEATQEAFRLIKQPELPTDPVGPSRLMALAAVLIGGTGLGAAAAVFCNRLKGVYESAWQLGQRFDVGVLGTISEVMTPAERKRLGYSRLVFGLACLALVGAFSGLAVAEMTDRLIPLGEQLRTQFLG